MSPRRFFVSFTLVGLATSHPRPAAAEPTAGASTSFERGRELMREGRVAEACPAFAQSQAEDPSAGTLLNLALCEQALGRGVAAAQHFEAVIAGLPADDPRRTIAAERLAQARARVAAVTLRFDERRERPSRVELDGEILAPAALSAPIAVDAGHHVVLTTNGAGAVARSAFDVAPGAKIDVVAAVAEVAPPSAPIAPPAEARPPRWHAVVPPVALGIAAAGLGVALVTGGVALARKRAVDDDCHGPICQTSAGPTAAASGRTWSTVSTVSFTVAVAAAAVGVSALVLRSADGGSVAPVVTPRAAGVVAAQSF